MISKFLVFNRYKSVERKEKKTWNLKKEHIPTKTKRWEKMENLEELNTQNNKAKDKNIRTGCKFKLRRNRAVKLES